SVYFRQNATVCNFSKRESWVVLSEIEQRIKAKIEAVGVPLKHWDINIYRGILTGYNEAFIIDGKKKDELIAEDPKSAEIIRPILRGRDIKRYGYDFADLWLINSHNGIKEKGVKRIEINDYPSIKKHLDQYYPQLEKRADKGDTPYNLRNCAYMEDFSKQKIAWNRIASEKLFSLVDEGIIIQDSMHFFTGNHLKFLCAILNSKLFSWFMYLIIGDTAGGNAGNSDNIRNLTIPKPNRELEIQIERLIKSEQYREIDKVVYKLYDISEQEIAFIDAQ
uniref:TaqI-like C-terminal specificity domain-containing protein n=1 Tax=uncultured Weeksella sp. TaxID=1161389 RepID=UPI00259B684D